MKSAEGSFLEDHIAAKIVVLNLNFGDNSLIIICIGHILSLPLSNRGAPSVLKLKVSKTQSLSIVLYNVLYNSPSYTSQIVSSESILEIRF
jgi:hypothetical protein